MLDQPALRLGDQTGTVDLAAWTKTRHPRFPSERPIRMAPDWVCEVVDWDTAAHDRGAKADSLLALGVHHYWLLEPRSRLLEAWQASDGRWVRQGAWTPGQTATIAPFHAVALEVAALFPPSLGD